jgi:hypothetical protein
LLRPAYRDGREIVMPIKLIVTWGPLRKDAKHCLKLGVVLIGIAAVMLGCIRLFFNSVDSEWPKAHFEIATFLASVCVFDFAALLFGGVYLIVGLVLLIVSKFK